MTFTDRFQVRPLSYSQLASFEYDPEQWWRNYVLEQRDPTTPAMAYGTYIGDLIGTPECPIPGLTPPGKKEYALQASLGEIKLVGYCDHFCPDTLVLHENKTSDKPDRWDQNKVHHHGQLTMYALMLFLRDKIKPEDIEMYLNFVPVVRGGDMLYKLPDPPIFHSFPTSRNTMDIMKYSRYILDTVKKMEEYYDSHI